jgi:hypothetical protein
MKSQKNVAAEGQNINSYCRIMRFNLFINLLAGQAYSAFGNYSDLI